MRKKVINLLQSSTRHNEGPGNTWWLCDTYHTCLDSFPQPRNDG